jgi:hypothetical protein
MKDFVLRLRKSEGAPVIDPGLLRVKGWPNAVYGRFFFAVISEFVSAAWFLDGWEYSRGATSELVLCLERGIPCHDERGALLSRSRIRTQIDTAAAHIEQLGHDASRFRARLDALADLESAPHQPA